MSWSLSWNTEVNILKRVSVESYQFVLSQAKEKLDEVVKRRTQLPLQQ
jgi:hypothetical protein